MRVIRKPKFGEISQTTVYEGGLNDYYDVAYNKVVTRRRQRRRFSRDTITFVGNFFAYTRVL